MKAPIKLLGCSLLLCATATFAQEEDKKPFTLEGELGFIATTGNTDTTSIKGRINSTHEMLNWTNEYNFEGFASTDQVTNDAGEDITETTAQRYFLSAQGNYKLENPNNRLFLFASHEDDRFSNFRFQSTVAGGWNQKLWDTDKSRFSYSVGPGYAYAKTQADETVNGVIVRAAADYLWKISDTAQFIQQLSTETGSGNTKSKSETSLSATISEDLSLKVSLILNHNSQVAEGIDNLDTETSVTIVYSFF